MTAASGGRYKHLMDSDVFPVLDARNTGSPAYLKSWVAEVSLSLKNGSIIKQFAALTSMLQRIRIARATVKKFSEGSEFANERKRARAMKALGNAEKELGTIRTRYSSQYSSDCVGAFVIFQNEASLLRALEDYRGSDSMFSLSNYWLQPPPLRFRGKHRLSIIKAPDPSTLIHQNLELSACNRFVRQSFVNLAMLFLIACSAIFIIIAQAQTNKFREAVPSLSVCNALPAIAYGEPLLKTGLLAPGASMPDPTPYLVYQSNDATCSALGRARFYYRTDDPAATLHTSRGNANPCLNECIDTSATCNWPTSDGGNLTFSMASVKPCYCLDLITTDLSKMGISGVYSIINSPVCGQVAKDYVVSSAFLVIAALGVVIVNQILRFLLAWMTQAFEGHPTIGSLHSAIAIKVFFSLFLNTAILILVINAALPASISSVTIAGQKIFYGSYASMDIRWQVAVGSAVVLTM
jgi:hypothetical protein